MKTWLTIACAITLLASGAAAMGQADPFVTAAYDISVKHDAEALAIVDSGQFDINMQNEEAYTLLHLAADNGNLEMVRALLSRGADARLKTAGG